MPLEMFLRSRFLMRWGSRAISKILSSIGKGKPLAEEARASQDQGLLLLAGDSLGLALAGAGIGVGALPANGQALTMAQAAIAGQIHQALDVHRGCATKIAFHRMLGVDRLAD